MKKECDNKLTVAIALMGIVVSVVIFLIALFALLKMFITYKSVKAVAEAVQPIPVEEILEHEKAYNREVREWKERNAEEVVTEKGESYLIEITEEEIDLMARVVMSEASTLSFDAKQAIAQTIVNRVRDEIDEFRNQNTVTEVVMKPHQYSTQDNGEPDQDCYDAVYQALTYKSFPIDMFWFREDHYHRFGEPYINIGTTYFSRSAK